MKCAARQDVCLVFFMAVKKSSIDICGFEYLVIYITTLTCKKSPSTHLSSITVQSTSMYLICSNSYLLKYLKHNIFFPNSSFEYQILLHVGDVTSFLTDNQPSQLKMYQLQQIPMATSFCAKISKVSKCPQQLLKPLLQSNTLLCGPPFAPLNTHIFNTLLTEAAHCTSNKWYLCIWSYFGDM